MNNSTPDIQRFDAYLHNEMTADERAQFEQELETNATLRAGFTAHQQFIHDLRDGSEYGDIRHTLRAIHNKSGVVRRNFFLTPQFLVPLAMAASLALIVTVISPFVREGNVTADNGDYQELEVTPAAAEAEDTSVADSSVSIMNQYSDDLGHQSSPLFLPELKNAPAGTAFMISDDGYFLTSKHLVDKKQNVKLQQKETGKTFEVSVVYTDSLADFAILKCHESIAAGFKPVPFKFFKKDVQLGQDVFTLGYPKNDIVYTKGVVSSEKGYKSDTLSFEVSLPSNPGYSGAPLFTYEGDLIGIVIANNTRQQAVTYVLNQHYIQDVIQTLSKDSIMEIDMSSNFTKRYKQHSNLVDNYRSCIFEVHP